MKKFNEMFEEVMVEINFKRSPENKARRIEFERLIQQVKDIKWDKKLSPKNQREFSGTKNGINMTFHWTRPNDINNYNYVFDCVLFNSKSYNEEELFYLFGFPHKEGEFPLTSDNEKEFLDTNYKNFKKAIEYVNRGKFEDYKKIGEPYRKEE